MSGRLRRLYSADPAQLLLDQFRGRIANGPFKEMVYLRNSVGSALAPKIAGTYEKELAPIIEKLASRGYEMVVDIGAAEGYYAVGLAKILGPNTLVLAYDTSEKARQLLVKLAELNQVAEQITIGDLCSHDQLQSLAGRRVFVLCDIEGGEAELLDPALAPALKNFDVLVEVHDSRDETTTQDLLRKRFEPTHKIEVIDAVKRANEVEARGFWIRNESMCQKIFDEKRERGMRWFFMRSNSLNLLKQQ